MSINIYVRKNLVLSYNQLPHYIKLEHSFAKCCSDIYINGIAFDGWKAKSLLVLLSDKIKEIDKQLLQVVPKTIKKGTTLKVVYKKDGSYTEAATRYMESGNPYRIVEETMERWTEEVPNLASHDVLRTYLLSLGWKPADDDSSWNHKMITNREGKKEKLRVDGQLIRTTPKIPSDDEEIEELGKLSPSFKQISDRLHISHRLHTIEGYMRNVRLNGRIPMGINPCGATTARVTHSIVANVPRITSYLGTELRSLFIAPPERVLVGVDADGLEARTIAHYFNDPIFTDLILNGDVHQYFYDEHFKDYVLDRSSMKNLFYAFVYGGGNAKLGSMCNNISRGSLAELGKEVKRKFGESIPGMKILIDQLEEAYELRGGIKGLDGRFIKCRKKSSLLNTLCQSAGAIACKKWTVLYRDNIKQNNIDSKHIIFYHDSNTEETNPEDADRVGKIMVDALGEAGRFYNLNVPLTAKYSIGANWSETK